MSGMLVGWVEALKGLLEYFTNQDTCFGLWTEFFTYYVKVSREITL